jgi:hypothetical protein
MMKLLPATFDLMLKTQMPQMGINLVLQFPNSTILHRAFVSFVEAGLTNTAFARFVIPVYSPILTYNGEYNDNRLVKGCCMRIMDLFLVALKNTEVKEIWSELGGVREFVEGPMKQYKDKKDKSYGGELPALDFKSLGSWFR